MSCPSPRSSPCHQHSLLALPARSQPTLLPASTRSHTTKMPSKRSRSNTPEFPQLAEHGLYASDIRGDGKSHPAPNFFFSWLRPNARQETACSVPCQINCTGTPTPMHLSVTRRLSSCVPTPSTTSTFWKSIPSDVVFDARTRLPPSTSQSRLRKRCSEPSTLISKK